MRLEDLIESYRRQSMDQKSSVRGNDGDVFCKDEEVVWYLNEGVQEACERADLIQDRTSPFCTILLVPGQDTYRLHRSVYEVKRLTLRGRPLDETSVEELDCDSPGWECRSGLPRCYVFEQAGGSLPAAVRLVPTPSAAETIKLTVYRGAQSLLCNDMDQPEIASRLHIHLVDWALYRAYSREDTDMYNDAKAGVALERFEKVFGKRPDANVQRKQRDRRPPLVHSNW